MSKRYVKWFFSGKLLVEKYQVITQQEKLQLFCKMSAGASHFPYCRQGGNNLHASEKRNKQSVHSPRLILVSSKMKFSFAWPLLPFIEEELFRHLSSKFTTTVAFEGFLDNVDFLQLPFPIIKLFSVHSSFRD